MRCRVCHAAYAKAQDHPCLVPAFVCFRQVRRVEQSKLAQLSANEVLDPRRSENKNKNKPKVKKTGQSPPLGVTKRSSCAACDGTRPRYFVLAVPHWSMISLVHRMQRSGIPLQNCLLYGLTDFPTALRSSTTAPPEHAGRQLRMTLACLAHAFRPLWPQQQQGATAAAGASPASCRRG